MIDLQKYPSYAFWTLSQNVGGATLSSITEFVMDHSTHSRGRI